jgi:hypothetical protein
MPTDSRSTADAIALFQPPAGLIGNGSLPTIGARAGVTTAPNPPDKSDAYTANASAEYLDYVDLSPTTRPQQLVFSFVADGIFLFTGPANAANSATASFWFSAAPGYASPTDGTFVQSVGPSQTLIAPGVAQATFMQRGTDAAAALTVNTGLNKELAFSFTPVSSGATSAIVTLTLQGSFLNRLENDKVQIDMRVSAGATAKSGNQGGVSSSFEHTLAMTGVAAYDANGNDVTASTVLGFGSVLQPVPEPGAFALFVIGLPFVAARRQRRRRGPAAEGAPASRVC